METHILLFFIALFCLIVYLARILIFIIFTGKLFHFSVSREKTRRKNVAPPHTEFEEREKVREESHKNKKK